MNIRKTGKDKPKAPNGVAGRPPEASPRFRARYRRMRLYIVFFTAFVSLTPLVIMTMINFYQYRKTLRAQMFEPIARLTFTSKRFIDDFLQERQSALGYVMTRESYEDLCDTEKLNRTILNLNSAFGGFVDLGVIDSDGNQRSYMGRHKLEGKNYAGQDWFHEVSIRRVHVSEVFMGYRNLPHFVIAVRKDFTDRKGFYVLRATIDPEVLNHFLASLDLRPSSDAFLINHEGILQTPSRHEGKILQPSSIAPPAVSLKPQVMEIVNRRGEPRILGYTYIEQTPFIFVILKHPQHVMGSWLLLRGDILWLLAASILLVVVVVIYGSRYLVNRVREADLRRDKALHSLAYTNKMASIGRMAAGVAHEINNPLAIINENAGLLRDMISIKDEAPEKASVLQIANTMLKSVERCSAITHRLLGFAKRMEPQVEQIELDNLIREVLSFQGKEAEYRRISVNIEVPEDLPTINSDRGLLQQVFLNILSNAFAAVEDEGRIDISMKHQDEMVAVTISDDGAGIPEEYLERIFEPFFSTKGTHGTGLGLSITFGIIERLGGRVEVQSQVGEGTTFTVRLPINAGEI